MLQERGSGGRYGFLLRTMLLVGGLSIFQRILMVRSTRSELKDGFISWSFSCQGLSSCYSELCSVRIAPHDDWSFWAAFWFWFGLQLSFHRIQMQVREGEVRVTQSY